MAPTRRTLFAGAGVTALAALPAATLALPTADPHPAWAAELREIVAYFESPAYDDLTDEEADDHPLWLRLDELERLIGSTPARTIRGVREQVWMALRLPEPLEALTVDHVSGMRLALTTLDRLDGRMGA